MRSRSSTVKGSGTVRTKEFGSLGVVLNHGNGVVAAVVAAAAVVVAVAVVVLFALVVAHICSSGTQGLK
ncbi:hypothetical protein B9Z19DRAFT_1124446 [Tuber borchii]|uniref:Uncharacterized protein n=1 Tax=Tuber borchii TaxID=42251 RepID=A0A2T6ZWN5_TUBBO|nr:hypothetical protein B9Z19DRAFT_1124446 [Tuber borchii]